MYVKVKRGAAVLGLWRAVGNGGGVQGARAPLTCTIEGVRIEISAIDVQSTILWTEVSGLHVSETLDGGAGVTCMIAPRRTVGGSRVWPSAGVSHVVGVSHACLLVATSQDARGRRREPLLRP